MSAACLMAGSLALAVTQGFSLGWTHSVERVGWQESWEVDGDRLHLIRARVRGSGAGMEPGDGAVLRDGWWEWSPDLRVAKIDLAESGATVSGWQLCTDSGCRELGDRPGAGVELRPCPAGVAGR